jgi:anti-sigma regulatory factor (Ser/Thr protein kinase)
MSQILCRTELRSAEDVVLARQQARQIAGLLGFDAQDQTRIVTAVFEIARNAWRCATSAKVEFSVELAPPQALSVEVKDHGRGISDLKAVTEGAPVSTGECASGFSSARRLVDEFSFESGVDGTYVRLGKHLRRGGLVDGPILQRIVDQLRDNTLGDPIEEIQRQNQELLATLDELQRRQQEVKQLGRELEETNRGVVALYAELDERADYLKRASELKSRFLSNMTHEFRTPLNSILSLSRLLLDRVDGELTPDQEKQAQFIQKAATDLSDLVNDLLDLAKVEAGKEVVRPSTFTVEDLFITLRGTTRPLLAPSPELSLTFEDASEMPVLKTDER